MYQTLKILLSFIYFFLSGFVYFIGHQLEGENIVELGYSSPLHPQKVIIAQSTSKADYLIYWNLTNRARRNKKTVWLYFAFNIMILIYAISSFLCLIYSFWFQSIEECFVLQCGWLVLTIVFHGGVTFVPGLLFLPSVQKRYRIKHKRKSNDTK